MRLHQALAKVVEDLGTTTVFGVLGDANLFFGDSLVRDTSVEFVGVAHEAGAVLSATGYASTSGKVGVATVTHGPAFSNTITPLIEAARNAVPVVLLAGDTNLEEEANLQDLPQEALVVPTGAGFIQVRNPEQAVRAVAAAFRRARVERRPIVVNIPRWLQTVEVLYEPQRPEPVQVATTTPAEDVLDRAAGLLSWARSPIVLGGLGAAEPGARAALIELAEFLGAPLATTLKGKGLFEGQARDIGVFGTLSTELGVELITKADCVAAFGASLSRYTTDAGALLKGKRVIQCSLDGAGLGATVNVDERLVGDTELTARALLAMLEGAHAKPAGWYTPEDAGRSAPRRTSAGSGDRRPGTVDLQQAVAWIEDNVPKQRHLILDGGRFLVPALMGLSVPEVRSYVHTLGIGAIGLGVANAIGAWKGRPDRPALTVAGDGGFMLGGLTEFNTAVRAGVDLILFILNDGAYGAEHVQFTRLGMDPAVVEINWPDFAPVADALGGRGFTVRGMDDFDQVRQAIEQRDRPLLIDVKLDPYAVRVDGH